MGVRVRNVSRISQSISQLRALNNLAVEIGVFSSSGTNAEGVNYVIIAGVHEFGVSIRKEKGSINIPERSFLRSTFDEKSEDWLKFMKNHIPKVITSDMQARQLMELLGTKITSDIQKKIKDINDPPNAPSTIAAKGSSNPLIDTGGLRMRITYRVVSK